MPILSKKKKYLFKKILQKKGRIKLCSILTVGERISDVNGEKKIPPVV